MDKPSFENLEDIYDHMDGLEDDLSHLARVFLSLMEGDTHLVDEAFEILKRRNLCDEDEFEL